MSTRAVSKPALTASLIRRRPRRLLPAPPSAHARPRPVAPPITAGGWADDLRFFATCYAAGLVFFLVMLS